jgi:adenylosuccinate lyase
MATWTGLGRENAATFRASLLADPDVAGRISPVMIDAAMDSNLHLKEIDTLFKRVFNE